MFSVCQSTADGGRGYPRQGRDMPPCSSSWTGQGYTSLCLPQTRVGCPSLTSPSQSRGTSPSPRQATQRALRLLRLRRKTLFYSSVRPCPKTKPAVRIVCPQIGSKSSLYFSTYYVIITWQSKFSMIMYKFINYSCLIYKKENEMLKFVKWLCEICMTMTDMIFTNITI